LTITRRTQRYNFRLVHVTHSVIVASRLFIETTVAKTNSLSYAHTAGSTVHDVIKSLLACVRSIFTAHWLSK